MICPNKDCRRNVSPFDTTCPNCGAGLKSNPVSDYEKKANDIANRAAGRTEALREEIRSGFKGSSSTSIAERNRDSRSAELGFKQRSEYGETGIDAMNAESQSGYRRRSKDLLAIISQRKDVKLQEMQSLVINNPLVTGNPDYSAKVAATDFKYQPNDFGINAHAWHVDNTKRYGVEVLDGFLNFMVGIECYFKYKDERILLSLMSKMAEPNGLDVDSVLDVIGNHVNNEQELFEIIENSFVPCFETIAHEYGHICLGHCNDNNLILPLEVSRNREREADSFASSIIASLFHREAKKPLFISYVKCEFAWALLDRIYSDIFNKDVRASTHPLAAERLKNAIRSNSDLAKDLSLSEEWVDKTLDNAIAGIKQRMLTK